MDRDFSDHLFKPGNTKESLKSVDGFSGSESNEVTGFGASAIGVDNSNEQHDKEEEAILSVDMFDDMFGDSTPFDDDVVSCVGNNNDNVQPYEQQEPTKKISLKEMARSSVLQKQTGLLEKSDVAEHKDEDKCQEHVVSKDEDPSESILNLGKKNLIDLLDGSDDLNANEDTVETKGSKQDNHTTSNQDKPSKQNKALGALKFLASTDNMSPLEQRTHKLKIVVAICLVGFLCVSCVVYGVQSIFSNKDDVATSTQTTTYPNINNVVDQAISKRKTLTNETFTGLSEVVEDILIVDKYAEVNKDGLVLYLGGTTTKLKAEVSVPVTLETYNSIPNGSLVKIGFKVIEIDKKKYCTEYNLMEVIE